MGFAGTILKDRKARGVILLVLTAAALATTVYVQFFRHKPEAEGAARSVVCPKCHESYSIVVKDLKDLGNPACRCRKCGGQLGYAWICGNCGYEFPYVPKNELGGEELKKMKTMEKFHFAEDLTKCPNCGSSRTRPLPAK